MTYKHEIITPAKVQKPSRPVDRVFLHCSAHSGTSVGFYGVALARTVHRWHLQRWRSGCGYHFLIDYDGKIITGRPLEINPVAQRGHNANTIAICCHGGGGNPPVDDFTAKQKLSVKRLCRRLNDLYDGKITFHGHREVAKKACPVYDYKDVLQLDNKGRLGI